MKISIIPASTQVGTSTIETLLKQSNPPQIRAIYRNTAKAPTSFTAHANFEAVQGGLDDGLDLDFADSDAVFYVPPPIYDDAVDSGEHATRSTNKVKAALEKAPKVKRLVILSALGSQHSEGIVSIPADARKCCTMLILWLGYPEDQPHHRHHPRRKRARGRHCAAGLVFRELGRSTGDCEGRALVL